jgi:hypothetical protein
MKMCKRRIMVNTGVVNGAASCVRQALFRDFFSRFRPISTVAESL